MPTDLALSCLQGRPMDAAFRQLWALEPDGVQLCPGCLPTAGFAVLVSRHGRRYTTHHGFSWTARRRQVWKDGQCLVRAGSVHPPVRMQGWERWLETWVANEEGAGIPLPALETMYGDHLLGSGEELDRAMDLGVLLAVDVSHLWIQLQSGVLEPRTWLRLQDYDRIAEIHVSANDGHADQHRPLRPDSFGLAWAQQRQEPVILECYLHRLDADERRTQLALARGVA